LHEAKAGNWGKEYIEQEIYNHINSCEWYKVYDIAEEIYSYLKKNNFNNRHNSYAASFNELCSEKGIGWHFQNGHIVRRGAETEEKISKLLLDQLNKEIYPTAKNELEEAFIDISRKPTADITGSIRHAVAALECVARRVTGLEKCTLGEIIKKHRTLFPKPLDEVVEKIWGYTSEKARHIKEGSAPSFQEAVLIIGLSSSLIAFLNSCLPKEPKKEFVF
jgi:AbiJ N-terminal domain 4